MRWFSVLIGWSILLSLAACAPGGAAALAPAADAPAADAPAVEPAADAPACTFAWAFENPRGGCPDAPAHTFRASAQHFEHGWLLHDGAHLHVFLTAEGRPYQQIDAPLALPNAGPSVVPPEGLHAPAEAFGEAWVGGLREPLGWAAAPAVAYDAWRQCDSSDSPEPACYLSGADGAVYRVELSAGGQAGVYELVWSPAWATLPSNMAN